MATRSRAESRAPSAESQMIHAAAAEIKNGDVVFVGIGLPSLACNLARATHAPNVVLIYESGTIDTRPSRIPLSIGDPALVTGAAMIAPMTDVFHMFLQRGRIDIGFLGAAQVDRAGNINTTVIGTYDSPKVRLPGAGGATEIGTHAKRVLVVTRLDRRAFRKRVDFVSTPGRRVQRVITDKCILDRDAHLNELVLSALFPGVTAQEVRDSVDWDLRVADNVGTVSPPPAAVSTALDALRSAR